MWNENRKSKTIALIVDHWPICSPNLVGVGWTVTEIDAVDYTGWKNLAIFDITSRYISVTVYKIALSCGGWLLEIIFSLSDNGDIANDLEWALTTPSSHFCKFWGPCPFPNSLSPTSVSRRCSCSLSQFWAFMYDFHTLNCHAQNCARRAIFRLGIETLIANILVSLWIYHH